MEAPVNVKWQHGETFCMSHDGIISRNDAVPNRSGLPYTTIIEKRCNRIIINM
jgi:hypothetical protein